MSIAKCFNRDCTFEGESYDDYQRHAMYCSHRAYDRFCGCYACEGHREGKQAARDLEATVVFAVDLLPEDRGRFLEGVRR